MFAIIASGGWFIMLPLLLCSIAVIAISAERFWTLNPEKIVPKHQLGQVWSWLQANDLGSDKLKQLRKSSQLGRILAAGLSNSRHGRDVMKDSIQESANQVIHELERYLGTLGTIAAVSPLLGLLGTVIGMIKVFTALNLDGAGNPSVLAGGISEALVTTAAGLLVAIPAMMSHRYFVRRVDSLVVTLEQEAIKLVDALHNDRRVDMKAE